MTVEHLENEVRALPAQDLASFVSWLDAYLGRLDTEPDDLSAAQRTELLRRRDEVLATPSLARPMDASYFAGLKQELADARDHRASGG